VTVNPTSKNLKAAQAKKLIEIIRNSDASEKDRRWAESVLMLQAVYTAADLLKDLRMRKTIPKSPAPEYGVTAADIVATGKRMR
jgi:hypothetical protein